MIMCGQAILLHKEPLNEVEVGHTCSRREREFAHIAETIVTPSLQFLLQESADIPLH